MKSFTREDIFRFIQSNYHTDQIVFCSVGQKDFKKVVKLAEKYFGEIPENRRVVKRKPVLSHAPRIVRIDKDTYQSHVVIGGVVYDYNHPSDWGCIC
ncbi:insulinase family protein [Saccharicrinis fermentans]|uniref:insulinase family protein n=1 Tax=Saccharicrinis fermentans TaxID=982 RepID=UPI0021D33791|nr:insulinase family protein [Saccharicrinis fermentans]